MKNSITFLIVCVITMCLGCTQDEMVPVEETTKIIKSEINRKKKTFKHPLAPEIVEDQIVVQYKNKKIKEEEKKELQKLLGDRYYFKVKETKSCKCDDTSIELWILNISDPSFGNIEDLVASLSTDKDGAGKLNADFQFSFFVKEGDQNINGEGDTFDREDLVHLNSSEDRVNIAVIDTGIDYDYFDTRFLYNNSQDTSDCLGKEVSGWDFVNDDNNPRDDHGHGTFATAIIRDVLTAENIPYQILPIKAFDSDGKGRYFDVLCALQHIASKNKPFLVNCSFGFYNLKNQVIFENIVENNADNLLLMASAGNDKENTDLVGSEHFPSGYKSDNVLAVGGYIGDFFGAPYLGMLYVNGFSLAPDSNYGNTSIDVVASFEYSLTLLKEPEYDLTLSKKIKKTSFDNNRMIDELDEIDEGISRYQLQGTSFSCPIVTARAAAVYYRNRVSPRQLKSNVIGTSFRDASLHNKIKNSNIIIKGHYRVPDPIGPVPGNPM